MPHIPLYEIPNARQIAGEPLRRWFYSNEQDLYVWTDEGEQIVAFQLCYGKRASHSALHWHQASGFKHLHVDEWGYGTPLLVANGYFDKAAVLESFHALSAQVPADISAFVRTRLDAYPIGGKIAGRNCHRRANGMSSSKIPARGISEHHETSVIHAREYAFKAF